MIIGKNAKLYYRSAGTFGSPTWTLTEKISDLQFALNFGRVGVATRDSVIERTGKIQGPAPLTFKVKQDLTEAFFLAVWTAIISLTETMDFMILNGLQATNGVRGFRGDFQLFSNTDNQNLDQPLFYDITAEPYDGANAFQSVVVAAGAPVFTTMSPA